VGLQWVTINLSVQRNTIFMESDYTNKGNSEGQAGELLGGS
jgi:hypothetical protein